MMRVGGKIPILDYPSWNTMEINLDRLIDLIELGYESKDTSRILQHNKTGHFKNVLWGAEAQSGSHEEYWVYVVHVGSSICIMNT